MTRLRPGCLIRLALISTHRAEIKQRLLAGIAIAMTGLVFWLKDCCIDKVEFMHSNTISKCAFNDQYSAQVEMIKLNALMTICQIYAL